MDESLGVLAVVHGADARNESKDRGQPGTRPPGRWLSTRRHGNSSGWRHGAAHVRGQTLLAVNNATDVSRAAVAQWLPTRAAVCGCGNIGMIGAVHAVLLFSRA